MKTQTNRSDKQTLHSIVTQDEGEAHVSIRLTDTHETKANAQSPLQRKVSNQELLPACSSSADETLGCHGELRGRWVRELRGAVHCETAPPPVSLSTTDSSPAPVTLGPGTERPQLSPTRRSKQARTQTERLEEVLRNERAPPRGRGHRTHVDRASFSDPGRSEGEAIADERRLETDIFRYLASEPAAPFA
ncbi:hypothetical protein AAFF_G00248290 [Aldrovandia affinis]|uniref:Uncharacterized protein n=1 Tax=Aldrovandia affinis TaxID=143900 RepID=A0AAD7RDJ3_9TELE|nr:hypothetical protein AAFF_G00248290 [Aldrovandia affinis]